MDFDRNLLILDLDETLIHSTETELEYSAEFKVDRYYVYPRPHLQPFLKFCFENFQVAVWTASTIDYAQPIIDRIFPNPEHLAFLWSNDRCTLKFNWQTGEYQFIKDLKKVTKRGYPLAKILFVDDRPENLVRQYSNLIQVKPFLGDRHDIELQFLTAYLSRFVEVENVRPIEKRNWRVRIRKAIGPTHQTPV